MRRQLFHVLLRNQQWAKLCRNRFTVALVILFAAPVAPVHAATTTGSVAKRGAVTEDQRFESLVAASDEADLKLTPMNAVARGDLRFAGQFGDLVSTRYYAALEANARRELAQLRAIDRRQLSATTQLAYDVFRYQTDFKVRSFDNGTQRILQYFPIDDYTGLHLSFPQWSSGEDVAPFKSLRDYRFGLQRFGGYAAYLGQTQKEMRRGIEAGYTLSRGATERLLTQLTEAIAQAQSSDSPFLRPLTRFPGSVRSRDRQQLRTQYRQALQRKVVPALQALREFIKSDYWPAARTGPPGLASLRDGERLYRFWLEFHTTTGRSADEIHELGQSEVARILKEMDSVRQRVAFAGTLSEFFQHLRRDPQFKLASADALLNRYRAIHNQVQSLLPKLFHTLPKGSVEVRSVPAEQAATVGGAFYVLGTPDGSRPGIFYANTTQLESRTTPAMIALYLHEAVPGHHLQGTLTQENTALPAFLRFGWNTGYGEGWALYAESLGVDLGLYADSYAYFGRLDLEMFRALRLVVDTGLHAKGWSRQQAIDYMVARSSLDRGYVEQEVDRYIAWPGQATAYKVGEIVIRQLRERAAAALGVRFDVRDFHDQVLDTGCLPLQVLEQKIDRWIAATQG